MSFKIESTIKYDIPCPVIIEGSSDQMADTKNSADPELPYVEGFVKEGFGKVKDIFRENLSNGSDKGSSFAAYYKGELVVNLWGGWVEKEASQRWREDTMPCFYSATKSPSSIVIAHLVDRENFKILARIWAEWKGKHHTGDLYYPQGTKHGYHPITFALYLDQIVRRVDPQGPSLSQYFQEEIAKPFDIEFYIGLPKELFYRAPRITLMQEQNIDEMNDFEEGNMELLELVMTNHKDGAMNDPYIREIPSGSSEGHGTVAALAKFHSILATGGVYEGKRLLSEKAIKRQMIPKSCGPDAVFGFDYIWSLGTMLFAAADENEKPIFFFGHEGYGGQLAVAYPTFKVGYAFGTNHLNTIMEDKPGKDMRSLQLSNALYECIYRIENRTAKRRAFESYSEMKEYQKSLSK